MKNQCPWANEDFVGIGEGGGFADALAIDEDAIGAAEVGEPIDFTKGVDEGVSPGNLLVIVDDNIVIRLTTDGTGTLDGETLVAELEPNRHTLV